MPDRVEPGASRRVEFFAGRQPLVQWFRSVVVFLEDADPADERASSPEPVSAEDHLRAVETWLKEYGAWYRSVFRMRPGLRIRLLYFRELQAVGGIRQIEALGRLCEVARRLGLAFAYTFDAEELVANEEAARRLVSLPGFALPRIRIGDEASADLADPVTEEVVALLERGASVEITASPAQLRRFRLLGHPAVSSRIMRLTPTGKGVPPPVASNAPLPCSQLFRLHVSRAGGVYPCRGLLDVPAARLASVYDPFDDSVLAGRETRFDLPALAWRGPESGGADVAAAVRYGDRRVPSEPWQCEWHRAALLAAG